MVKDYYAVLGVAPDAGPGDIKAAYRRSLLCLHPDKKGNLTGAESDAASYLLVQEAWKVLSDPKTKIAYDEQLAKSQTITTQVPIHDVILFSELREADKDCYQWSCRCGGEFVVFREDFIPAEPNKSIKSNDASPSASTIPCDILIPCSTCSLHLQVQMDSAS